MDLIIKYFDELTNEELLDIFKLRISVFVVEQNCPYQEIDDADKVAYHIYLKDDNGIQAYLRVLPKGVLHKEVSLGRVIAVKRRCGLGSKIISAGIKAAKDFFNADTIEIEAQVYAQKFYENSGFIRVSEEFLVDGIPHIKMILKLSL